jgi:hypothetical protein
MLRLRTDCQLTAFLYVGLLQLSYLSTFFLNTIGTYSKRPQVLMLDIEKAS